MTRKLEIDEFLDKEYVNDSLILDTSYEIKFTAMLDTAYVMPGAQEYEVIEFESGVLHRIEHIDDHLYFYEVDA